MMTSKLLAKQAKGHDKASYRCEVSGVAPKHGPPGTRITIRGQNFGDSIDDIVDVTIDGLSARKSLEYHSSTKLLCVAPRSTGSGFVLVTTKRGGVGSSNVKFSFDPEEIEVPDENLLRATETDAWPTFNDFLPAYEPRVGYAEVLQIPTGDATATDKTKTNVNSLGSIARSMQGDLTLSLDSDTFNPMHFLEAAHQNTTFEQLIQVRRQLQKETEGTHYQLSQWVKEDFDTFVKCTYALVEVRKLHLDVLSALADAAAAELAAKRPTSVVSNILQQLQVSAPAAPPKPEMMQLTGNLLVSIDQALKLAKEMFDPILERRSVADVRRNAISVLERFSMLFRLPQAMKRSLTSDDYSGVVQDYKRAVHLFADSNVEIFREVLQECQNLVSALRAKVVSRLKQPALSSEHDRLIAYLLELDPNSDATWVCYSGQLEWLQDQWRQLAQDALLLTPQFRGASLVDGDAPGHIRRKDWDWQRIRQINLCSRSLVKTAALSAFTHVSEEESTASREKQRDNRQRTPSTSETRDSESHESTELNEPIFDVAVEMCELAIRHLPRLWNLGTRYFAGSSTSASGPAGLKRAHRHLGSIAEQSVNSTKNTDTSTADSKSASTLNAPIKQPENIFQQDYEKFFGDCVQALANSLRQTLLFDAPNLPSEDSTTGTSAMGMFFGTNVTSAQSMSACLQAVEACIASLLGATIPPRAVTALRALVTDFQSACVRVLCDRLLREIGEFTQKECKVLPVTTSESVRSTVSAAMLAERSMVRTFTALTRLFTFSPESQTKIVSDKAANSGTSASRSTLQPVSTRTGLGKETASRKDKDKDKEVVELSREELTLQFIVDTIQKAIDLFLNEIRAVAFSTSADQVQSKAGGERTFSTAMLASQHVVNLVETLSLTGKKPTELDEDEDTVTQAEELDERVLIATLSNVEYFRVKGLVSMASSLHGKLTGTLVESVRQKAFTATTSLYNQIVDVFQNQMLSRIERLLREGLKAPFLRTEKASTKQKGVRKDTALQPRPYLSELLLALCVKHKLCTNMGPAFIKHVFQFWLSETAVIFGDCVSELKHEQEFDQLQQKQALMEIECIHQSLGCFSNEETEANFLRAHDAIECKISPDIDSAVDLFCKSSKFQLSCFL